VIGYNVYWIFIMLCFFVMRYKETSGHYPFLKAKAPKASDTASEAAVSDSDISESKVAKDTTHVVETISEK
jgi:high-affinity iron transporter